MLNLKPIVRRILKSYTLPWDGIHGVSHWARVLENGLRLAQVTAANIAVVELFAVFRDSYRVNEGVDPGHGQRGADLAADRRGDLFHAPDAEFRLLYNACVGHTDGRTEADTTIQTCWDAAHRSTAGLRQAARSIRAGTGTAGGAIGAIFRGRDAGGPGVMNGDSAPVST